MLLNMFPYVGLRFVVDLLYPYPNMPMFDGEQRAVIESMYKRFDLMGKEDREEGPRTNYEVRSIKKMEVR